MRHSLTFVLVATAALGCALLLPSAGRAQNMNWGADSWRAMQPGAYIPYGGAPVMERFNYPDPMLYWWFPYGQSSWTAYEIDRQERFEAFGTRYTPDHPPLFNRILNRLHR
jgi:hypothetical protein